MKYFYLVFSVIILLIIIGCNNIKDEILGPQEDTPDTEGFYTSSNNGFTLKYKVMSDSLHCKLSCSGNGWLSVGFDPTQRMQNANFIIGYVDNGAASIRDDWGVSQTTHEADVDLGGTSNIRLISGTEAGGSTTLEFIIPLNSPDSKDKVLIPNQSYHIIFAKGDADNFDAMHNSFGVSTITVR